MDKLFDHIAMENIATQINDPIVNEVVDHYGNIKKYMKMYRVKDSKHAYTKKDIKNELKKLDKAITDRFGLNYKHVYSTDGGYAIIPINQGVNNALAPYREQIVNSVEQDIEHCKHSGECGKLKDLKDVTGYNQDIYTIMTDYVESAKKIKKQLNSSKIKIDFNKAKIENFPKDTTLWVIGDIHTLLIELDLTPRELTAILFHEIGHSFTHISESYRQVESTSLLLETFTNNLKKTKSIRENIILTTKEVYNKDLKGNDVEVFTSLLPIITENINDNNTYSSIDSEQLADQFSNRFGLGKELVTSLNKMHITYKTNYVLIFAPIMLSVFLQALLVSLNIVVAAIATVIVLLLIVIIDLMSVFVIGNESSKATYDITETRFKRIKLDLIRQLRESGLSKEIVKDRINQIEEIEKLLTNWIDSRSLIGSIGDVMPWNIDKFTYTRLQKELEELSENDLHLATAKIKLLIGDK